MTVIRVAQYLLYGRWKNFKHLKYILKSPSILGKVNMQLTLVQSYIRTIKNHHFKLIKSFVFENMAYHFVQFLQLGISNLEPLTK